MQITPCGSSSGSKPEHETARRNGARPCAPAAPDAYYCPWQMTDRLWNIACFRLMPPTPTPAPSLPVNPRAVSSSVSSERPLRQTAGGVTEHIKESILTWSLRQTDLTLGYVLIFWGGLRCRPADAAISTSLSPAPALFPSDGVPSGGVWKGILYPEFRRRLGTEDIEIPSPSNREEPSTFYFTLLLFLFFSPSCHKWSCNHEHIIRPPLPPPSLQTPPPRRGCIAGKDLPVLLTRCPAPAAVQNWSPPLPHSNPLI